MPGSADETGAAAYRPLLFSIAYGMTARTVKGMARAGPGRLLPGLWSRGRHRQGAALLRIPGDDAKPRAADATIVDAARVLYRGGADVR